MDWFLSASTWFVNSNLGWSRGKRWSWGIHAVNAALWIAYAIYIKQYGLILLSVVTIVTDIISAYKME